jgi:hypothetical protein
MRRSRRSVTQNGERKSKETCEQPKPDNSSPQVSLDKFSKLSGAAITPRLDNYLESHEIHMESLSERLTIQLSPGDPNAQMKLFRIVNFKAFDEVLAFRFSPRKRRPRIPCSEIMKALVFQKLERIPSWKALESQIAKADVRKRIGLKRAFYNQRISDFTRQVGAEGFKAIVIELSKQLRVLISDFGEEVAIDSTMVWAYANPYNEQLSDPDAKWGVKKLEAGKPIRTYGYKLHLTAEAKHDLGIWEVTTGANRHDSLFYAELLDGACQQHQVKRSIADAAYDSKKNYHHTLKCKAAPVIDYNRRRSKNKKGRQLDKEMPIQRDSPEWKTYHAKRSAVERVFSHLKDLGLETHLKLRTKDRVEVHFLLCIVTLLILAFAAAVSTHQSLTGIEQWRD